MLTNKRQPLIVQGFQGSHPEQAPSALRYNSKPSLCSLQVIHMMTKRRVHRLYVVGKAGEPVGIITCTDLLRAIAGGK